MNAEPTRKTPEPSTEQTNSKPEMREQYDFRGGVRGKYIQRLAGSIRRDMVPEHARETWDVEKATYGELISRPRIQKDSEAE